MCDGTRTARGARSTAPHLSEQKPRAALLVKAQKSLRVFEHDSSHVLWRLQNSPVSSQGMKRCESGLLLEGVAGLPPYEGNCRKQRAR